MGDEGGCVSSVWPGMACTSRVRLCWRVQVLELGRRAGGEDQRLQLGRFYGSDDGCFYFAFTRSAHSMASIRPVQPQTHQIFMFLHHDTWSMRP